MIRTNFCSAPSGDAEILIFDIDQQEFMAISAGPVFKFNPSISFFVTCTSKDEVNTLWKKLSQNRNVLMDIGKYPFSELYGWVKDRYGLSWQIGYMGEGGRYLLMQKNVINLHLSTLSYYPFQNL